jgi:hypothetical protein
MTTSEGAAWSPRIEKRKSIVCRSRLSRKRKCSRYAVVAVKIDPTATSRKNFVRMLMLRGFMA